MSVRYASPGSAGIWSRRFTPWRDRVHNSSTRSASRVFHHAARAARQMTPGIVDNLAHVRVIGVGEFRPLGSQDLHDTTAAGVAGRLAAAALLPKRRDSSDSSHFSSSSGAMLTLSRNCVHMVGLSSVIGGCSPHSACRSAPGLCTASAPVLLLRTPYCGSSSDARTVRPAARVSAVILASTTPSTVLPWPFRVTWSTLRNALSLKVITTRLSRFFAMQPRRGGDIASDAVECEFA